MKKIKKFMFSGILSLIFSTSLLVAGCNLTTPEDSEESKKPQSVELKPSSSEVTNLTVLALDGSAFLSWTNPQDENYFATKITVLPVLENQTEENSSLTVEGKSGQNSSTVVEGLTNGTEYTFNVLGLVKNTVSSSENDSKSEENPAKTGGVTIKVTPADTSDKTSPDEVSNFEVIAANGTAILSWQDPESSDLFGIELTYKKVSENSERSAVFAPMVKGSIFIAPESNCAEINNLENDESYEFTLKTMDTSGNKSSGISTTAVCYDTSDKTPPADISDLTVTAENGSAVLSWKNPADEDFFGVKIAMSPAEGTLAVPVILGPEATTFTVSGLTNGTEYTFSIATFDTSLNFSTGETLESLKNSKSEISKDSESEDVTITKPSVESITLSKNHLAYNAADKLLEVLVTGKNFSYIAEQNDKTLKIQVTDSDGKIVSTVEAVIDAENNSATAEILAPELEKGTAGGAKYTVKAIICGTEDDEHTATFNISAPAAVSSVSSEVSAISKNDVTDSLTTKITVKGSNFDLAEKIETAVFKDSENSAVFSKEIDCTTFTQSTKTFSFDLPIFAEEGSYTVKILIDGAEQSKTVKIDVYGDAEFTSFLIPAASVSMAGKTLVANVIGKNFEYSKLDSNDFSVTCTDSENSSVVKNPEVKILNNSLISVVLAIPENAGTYEINFALGEKSISGNFNVKAESDYEIGDIILADGTKISVNDIENYTEESSNPAVCVVAGFNQNGIPFGLALKKSGEASVWAPTSSVGYSAKIAGTTVTCSGDEENGYVFEGDCDGSDNFELLCALDSTGTQNDSLAENYPAFYFVKNYGTNQKLSGNFADGWYLPSIAELYEISKNLNTVQASLTKAGGFSFGTNIYWSSSQSEDSEIKVYKIKLRSGETDAITKISKYSVVAVHAL